MSKKIIPLRLCSCYSKKYLHEVRKIISMRFEKRSLLGRVLLTRYRSGSHNLKIETGRLCCPKIPRENRTCLCGLGVQSLRHCLFECTLLREVFQGVEYTTLEEAFNSPDIVNVLMNVERVLKI